MSDIYNTETLLVVIWGVIVTCAIIIVLRAIVTFQDRDKQQ